MDAVVTLLGARSPRAALRVRCAGRGAAARAGWWVVGWRWAACLSR